MRERNKTTPYQKTIFIECIWQIPLTVVAAFKSSQDWFIHIFKYLWQRRLWDGLILAFRERTLIYRKYVKNPLNWMFIWRKVIKNRPNVCLKNIFLVSFKLICFHFLYLYLMVRLLFSCYIINLRQRICRQKDWICFILI